jgi:hypothetical protein
MFTGLIFVLVALWWRILISEDRNRSFLSDAHRQLLIDGWHYSSISVDSDIDSAN